MKKLTDFVKEAKGDVIDDQWINDERPVQTKDGRQVIVTSIDMKKIPNIVHGQVKMKEKLFDYEWEDNGKCIKALDMYGNPKKADESDDLVKAIDEEKLAITNDCFINLSEHSIERFYRDNELTQR